MTPLLPGEAHLWLGATGGEAERRLPGAWALLDASERARADRFLVEHARIEYVLSHGMVREVLSAHTGVDPRDFAFRAREHGKLDVASPGEHASVRFNLSHSRGLCAVAVAAGREVGVDVEERGERVPIEDMAPTIFSAPGLAAFAALPPDRRRAFFFAKWALKEALVKARGDGLTLDVRRIRADLTADLGLAGMWLDGMDVSSTWHVRPFRAGPIHAGALVIEARPGETLTVVEHSFGPAPPAPPEPAPPPNKQ